MTWKTSEANSRVDARGQKCPMPLLMAKRGLRDLSSGEILEVMATDPGRSEIFYRFNDSVVILLQPVRMKTAFFFIA